MSTQIFSERLISASGDLTELNNSLIVHVSSPEAFASAHIPGAVLLTPAELILGTPPAVGKIAEPTQLANALQRIGYRRDQTIVVYDDEGGGWAGRLIWTLDVIGHANWQYIDGGLHAWAAAGGAIETGITTPSPAPVAPTLEYNQNLIANCDALIGAVVSNDQNLAVWDARSLAEHLGQRSGSARPGRIPGSAHLDWLDVMDQQNNLCLRKDLQTCLTQRGITPDKTVVVHCQTHHRSGLAYLAARVLDYPKIKGYDGSWAEWGNREDTPIATGAVDTTDKTSGAV